MESFRFQRLPQAPAIPNAYMEISPSLETLLKTIRETTVKIIRMVESAQALPSAPLLTMLPVLKASSRMDDDSLVLISSCAQVTSSFMF